MSKQRLAKELEASVSIHCMLVKCVDQSREDCVLIALGCVTLIHAMIGGCLQDASSGVGQG